MGFGKEMLMKTYRFFQKFEEHMLILIAILIAIAFLITGWGLYWESKGYIVGFSLIPYKIIN